MGQYKGCVVGAVFLFDARHNGFIAGAAVYIVDDAEIIFDSDIGRHRHFDLYRYGQSPFSICFSTGQIHIQKNSIFILQWIWQWIILLRFCDLQRNLCIFLRCV